MEDDLEGVWDNETAGNPVRRDGTGYGSTDIISPGRAGIGGGLGVGSAGSGSACPGGDSGE